MKQTLYILLFILGLTTILMAQENIKSKSNRQTGIIIANPGFEMTGQNNLPVNWYIGEPATVSLDAENSKSGKFALYLNHLDWEQTEIISEPVQLQVGHLYKLSAWAKSEMAETISSDRYPTSVAGCITMASFPFTNHSPALGATRDWEKFEVFFIATRSTDQIRLHFGYNGKARGKIWFDEIQLEKVEDISQYIPPETVRWFNEGFRYDDQGWIFVHIEGEPYQRGYQYGYLVANEMIDYMNKLAIEANEDDPEKGWKDTRFIADAFMLRKYEKEYLTEMKGIADGANHSGIKLFGRNLDLLDVVTMNSAIDIEWARYAMPTTAHPLSGHNFLNSEDELNIPDRLHKCSSFLANKSSTTDQRIVFGQIFMWWGYTGPHWNVICDVIPAKGHRLVYETFPGGIHSGADFYINSAGIMIGETTVSQTPFNPEGSPQSNRIRKAAQYANNIDQVVKILTTDNNGMYANDWLIGDTKTDEIAVLLLGTNKHKLWRSGKKEFYGETNDFYWCNNNNKDPEVRKEYVPNKDNAPHDLIFAPWNRDLAFNRMYQKYKGKMDAVTGARILGSSPINRPHACDGKITTSEMAENLVFLAHSGKVTLREKFVGENKRIPDLPGAVPRLSLGYATASPIFIAEKLKEFRDSNRADEEIEEIEEKTVNSDHVIEQYSFAKRKLWINTIYPASEAENWFVSGTAAYWKMLHGAPDSKEKLLPYLKDKLSSLNCRYQYVSQREGPLAAIKSRRVYDQYKHYQIPRIKGTLLLHQLRLYLGNEKFAELMNKVHTKYREKNMKTADFIRMAQNASDKDMKPFLEQWLTRDDLPAPKIQAEIEAAGDEWKINLQISQQNQPYHFLTSIQIDTEEESNFDIIEIKNEKESFSFTLDQKPTRFVFNALNDIPLDQENYFTWFNFFDDYHQTIIVYGTNRQIEANHTLALRFSTVLADRYTESLPPVVKDSEVNAEELRNHDLIILGNLADNQLMSEMVAKLSLDIQKNLFRWNKDLYSEADQGLFAAFPNPFNPKRTVYLFNTNSAMQLYLMTKDRIRMPSWAIYEGGEIVEKGYHPNEKYIVEFE
jgi:hypothetical protein